VNACVLATHFAVELEHVMLELLRPPCQDWQAILRSYEIDPAQRTLSAFLPNPNHYDPKR
jgi:hypothetical protein